MDRVWVFSGEGSHFPSGVFTELELAEEWIRKHGLTGCLTSYPLNIGVYEWAIEKGYFTPKKESYKTAEFIGGFSSAYTDHYHYESGKRFG